MSYQISFGGEVFEPLGQAGLHWPSRGALLVSDLHLEKASSYAKTSGQMLPPYDSAATLQELSTLAADCGAEQIICLGDNFHDDDGERRLTGSAAELLTSLTQRYRWHWIIGNHDPGIGSRWGGQVYDEMKLAGIMLRHNIVPSDSRPEISGHYHPKLRMKLRGRRVSRRCFLHSASRLIMPAFGSLTGGMDARDICPLLPERGPANAWVAVRRRFVRFNLADA